MPPHQGSGSPGPSSAPEDEEESIYNLLPKTHVAQSKPPLYRSPRLRHAARQPPVASTIGAFGGPHLLGQARLERRPWAHWGPAGSQTADLKRFLRRGEGLLKARPSSAPAEPTTVAAAEPPQRKPPVPSHAVAAAGGGASSKGPWDFIYANAMDVITAVRSIDLLMGSCLSRLIQLSKIHSTCPRTHARTHAHAPQSPPPSEDEGEIDYLRKPDYGRVPAYLASVKASQIKRPTAYFGLA